MSLLEECDRSCYRARLAAALSPDRHHSKISVHSKSFIKSLFVFVCLVQPGVATWVNARHIVFPGHIHARNAAFSFNLVRLHVMVPQPYLTASVVPLRSPC